MTQKLEKTRSEMQELTLHEHLYRLVVELSPSTSFLWQAIGLKDGEIAFGPTRYTSEEEAKLAVHLWAFYEAGHECHACDGNCTTPWKPTF